MLNRRVVNTLTIIGILLLVLLHFFSSIEIGLLPILALTLIWFLLTIFGSFMIRWNYHFKSLHSNKKIDAPFVSITFDDGPNEIYTTQVLDLLKKYDAKAAFFCIGKQIKKHPELIARMVAEGHTIGNHTYSHHRNFGFFSTGKVIAELQRTNKLVKNQTDLEMNLYRPAFGVTNPKIQKALQHTRHTVIGWNVRSLDTTFRTEDVVFRRITRRLSKGDIILMHDTSHKSIAVLERLLLFLKEKNLQSIPVDQLLNIAPYA